MTKLVPVAAPFRVAGHFGEFLQGRLGPDGPVVLVTVPCPALSAEVEVSSGPFRVSGFDQEAVRRLFEAFGGLPNQHYHVSCDAPLGAGTGMSTAALLALAKAARIETAPEDLLAAEGAVDPLMLGDPDAVLWASRKARVVETFASPPDFAVVGGFLGDPLPTDPGDDHFPVIADLIPFWRSATERQDRAAVAGIATEAARRTTALRGPGDDPTEELAREQGALGIVRAHTGSARGLLFPPGKVPSAVAEALREAGFAQVIQFHTGGVS